MGATAARMGFEDHSLLSLVDEQSTDVPFADAVAVIAKLLDFPTSGIVRETFDKLVANDAEREAVAMLIPANWQYSSGRNPKDEYFGSVTCATSGQTHERSAKQEGLALLRALAKAIMASPSLH